MNNTFITPDVLSREATMVLKNEAVLFNLMRNPADEAEFTGDEKVGDTIKIVSPAPSDVRQFNGQALSRDATEKKTDLTVERHFYDQITVGSKDATLSLDRFSELHVQPIMAGFAEELAAYAAEKARLVPHWSGTPGVAPSGVADITAFDRVMNTNKARQNGRIAVVDEFGKAGLFNIEVFHKADARGDGGRALQAASLGRNFGFDWRMDQSIETHIAGTMRGAPALVNGAVAEGATVMAVDGGAGSETIKQGDLFTVAGVEGQFVFTEDAEAVGGAIGIANFFPAAPVGGFPDNALISILADHTKNLGFVPGAFTAVTFPPAPSKGAPSSSFFDNDLGFGVRVTYSFNSGSLSDTITFEALAGAAIKQPDLSALLLG